MSSKSWVLENAQAIAERSPYTFYKASAQVVSLLEVGHLVKLIFRFESDKPEDPAAERMWVKIAEIKAGRFVGTLANHPAYIQDLAWGDSVEFEALHIVDTELDDPVPSITKKYMKRCFVTNNILYGGEAVGYFYREAPDQEDDSGWRFTTGAESDDYMENEKNISYVSLGAVLRVDDSMLSFLEREGDVTFAKDDNGQFVELE